MQIRKLFVGVLLTLSALIFAAPAMADDSGVHTKFDVKVRTVDNLDIRLNPEFIFANKADGLRQGLVRLGPSYKATDWLRLGVNGYESLTLGSKAQDVRVEPQVDLSPKLGLLHINDRNRLGYRPLDNAVGNRWVYANELRFNFAHEKCSWIPFASEEVFLQSADGNVFNQNRVTGGVGYKWSDNRVDVGYMLRSDRTVKDGWGQSHFVVLALSTNR